MRDAEGGMRRGRLCGIEIGHIQARHDLCNLCRSKRVRTRMQESDGDVHEHYGVHDIRYTTHHNQFGAEGGGGMCSSPNAQSDKLK